MAFSNRIGSAERTRRQRPDPAHAFPLQTAPGAPEDAHARRRAEQRRASAWLGGAALAGAAALGWGFAALGLPALPGIAAGAMAGFLAARAGLRAAPGLPVLSYGSVSAQPDWLPGAERVSIRPASLERQLRLLRRMRLHIVDTEDMLRARQAGQSLPRNAVCLHFDGGYLDNWVAAAPILKRHGASATLFVATDFIAPDQPPRPALDSGTRPRWDGYMTWRELRMLEAGGVFRVETQGTDPGRVETGPRRIGRLTRHNIDDEAWMQWAQMPGDKHDWYRRGPVVPPGTPIRQSAPALSARRWTREGMESAAEFDDRLRRTFRTVRGVFVREMGRLPVLFAWPQDGACARGRVLAAEAGFLASTAGQGRNCRDEPADAIARIRVWTDRAGFRCGVIDDLALRAELRCFQGDFGWAPVIEADELLRRAVAMARRLRRARTRARPLPANGPRVNLHRKSATGAPLRLRKG